LHNLFATASSWFKKTADTCKFVTFIGTLKLVTWCWNWHIYETISGQRSYNVITIWKPQYVFLFSLYHVKHFIVTLLLLKLQYNPLFKNLIILYIERYIKLLQEKNVITIWKPHINAFSITLCLKPQGFINREQWSFLTRNVSTMFSLHSLIYVFRNYYKCQKCFNCWDKT